jgi:hypothetical protein
MSENDTKLQQQRAVAAHVDGKLLHNEQDEGALRAADKSAFKKFKNAAKRIIVTREVSLSSVYGYKKDHAMWSSAAAHRLCFQLQHTFTGTAATMHTSLITTTSSVREKSVHWHLKPGHCDTLQPLALQTAVQVQHSSLATRILSQLATCCSNCSSRTCLPASSLLIDILYKKLL